MQPEISIYKPGLILSNIARYVHSKGKESIIFFITHKGIEIGLLNNTIEGETSKKIGDR